LGDDGKPAARRPTMKAIAYLSEPAKGGPGSCSGSRPCRIAKNSADAPAPASPQARRGQAPAVAPLFNRRLPTGA